MKKWLIILLSLGLYISGRIFISSYPSFIGWLMTGFFFLYGFMWVYTFLMKKEMPSYAGGESMPREPEKKLIRLLHFLIGCAICIMASII